MLSPRRLVDCRAESWGTSALLVSCPARSPPDPPSGTQASLRDDETERTVCGLSDPPIPDLRPDLGPDFGTRSRTEISDPISEPHHYPPPPPLRLLLCPLPLLAPMVRRVRCVEDFSISCDVYCWK